MEDSAGTPGRAECRELTGDEVRAIQLDALSTFHEMCTRLGLRYYLGWGTLLGAVRHGGFIPWDDDVDVMMLRDDYSRLLQVFPGLDEARDFDLLSSRSDDRYPYPYAKFSDRSTTVVEQKNHRADLGVNLDIFPVDGTLQSPVLRAAHTAVLNGFRRTVNAGTVGERSNRGRLKSSAVTVVRALLSGGRQAGLSRMFERAASVPVRPRSTAGVRVGPKDWLVDLASFGDGEPIEFEGMTLVGPSEPDTILRAIYGDFMQLPPESQRVSHHDFSAYSAG